MIYVICYICSEAAVKVRDKVKSRCEMLINTVKELLLCVLSVKLCVRVLIKDAEVSRVRPEGAVPGKHRGDLL